jgi:ribonuclease D
VARDVISELSKETSIPAENILTPDYLRALCFEPRGLDAESSSTQLLELGARAWQVELVAEPLSKAFLAL